MSFIISAIRSVYVVAAIQFLIIVVFLLTHQRGNKLSRQLLASLFIVYCLFLSGSYLLLFPKFRNIVYFGHFGNLTIFLVAPLFYFYCQSYSSATFKLSKYGLIHLIPFLLVETIYILMFYFEGKAHLQFRNYGFFLIIVLLVQNLFYLLLLIKRKHSFLLLKSNVLITRWFRLILWFVISIVVMKLFIFISWNLFGMLDICIYLTGLIFGTTFIITNLVVLFGLYNPEVLIHIQKYQNSQICKELSIHHYNKLISLFDEEKIYLDPLLDLKRLAKKLSLTSKQVSQVINENSGRNFNDFINTFRINRAMQLIVEIRDKNIIDIAYEVGFNSKSTFNTAFKKVTGITPSQYKSTI